MKETNQTIETLEQMWARFEKEGRVVLALEDTRSDFWATVEEVNLQHTKYTKPLVFFSGAIDRAVMDKTTTVAGAALKCSYTLHSREYDPRYFLATCSGLFAALQVEETEGTWGVSFMILEEDDEVDTSRSMGVIFRGANQKNTIHITVMREDEADDIRDFCQNDEYFSQFPITLRFLMKPGHREELGKTK